VSQPGTTATVLSARRTRIVLSAAKLPSGNAIVIYLPNTNQQHCVDVVKQISYMRLDSNWTTALYKSFTYLLTYLLNPHCVNIIIIFFVIIIIIIILLLLLYTFVYTLVRRTMSARKLNQRRQHMCCVLTAKYTQKQPIFKFKIHCTVGSWHHSVGSIKSTNSF